MKTQILLGILLYALTSQAGSQTFMQCSVGKVKGYEGARINLLKDSNGDFKANLVFGTTVSGTMYHVAQRSDGLEYQGRIKNKDKFWLVLKLTNKAAQNRYIRGQAASLEVVYPTLQNRAGYKVFKSAPADNFVCGKQINNFRD